MTEYKQLNVNAKNFDGKIVTESPRQCDIRGSYDVVVCGGGPAGVAAAIAAGQNGARVCLIERWGFAGGMWTAGLVNPFFEWRGRGYLVKELVGRLEREGAFSHWCGSYCFSAEGMKRVLDDMLSDAGVDILYYTLAVDSVVIDSKVCGVIIESKAGREALMADVVIDCTGDGDIAARSGCQYEFGREADGLVQPLTLMFEIRNINSCMQRDSKALYDQLTEVLNNTHSDFKLPFPKSGAAPYIITLPGSDSAAVQATHVYRLNPLNPADLTAGTIDARRQAHELVKLFRQIKGFEDMEITTTAPSLGLRESRRVRGLYRMNVEDLRTGASFDDAVCSAAFPVDVHEPAPGDNIETHADMPMKPYDISYRSLLPSDVRGMLLAGRCISGDHFAHASYRVTGTAMAIGQAAGLAAAKAVAGKCDPADISGKDLKTDLAAKGARFVCDGVNVTDIPGMQH